MTLRDLVEISSGNLWRLKLRAFAQYATEYRPFPSSPRTLRDQRSGIST